MYQQPRSQWKHQTYLARLLSNKLCTSLSTPFSTLKNKDIPSSSYLRKTSSFPFRSSFKYHPPTSPVSSFPHTLPSAPLLLAQGRCPHVNHHHGELVASSNTCLNMQLHGSCPSLQMKNLQLPQLFSIQREMVKKKKRKKKTLIH